MTTSRPLFSVVIPTRNRSELVQVAIQSVLEQKFPDFELVVSNNSEGEERRRTFEAVERWQGDPRLRCIAPPEPLNMADHWEFATSDLRGSYVAILTDRLIMRPSALCRLAETVTTRPELVVFEVRSGYSSLSGLENTETFSARTTLHGCRDVLRDYLKLGAWGGENMYLNILPRGLNSIYSSDLAQRIRERCGRLFWPLCPDYTSAFLCLAFAKELVSLELPCYMAHGNQSNGRDCLINGIDLAMKHYPGIDPYEFCPQRFDTVLNTIVRDFYFIRGVARDELSGLDFDICGYYLSNYREFLLKEQLGSALDLKAQYRIWQEGVAALPDPQRSEVLSGLEELQRIRPRFRKLRALARSNGWDAAYHSFFFWLRRMRGRLKGRKTYPDALEAARATDYYLTVP